MALLRLDGFDRYGSLGAIAQAYPLGVSGAVLFYPGGAPDGVGTAIDLNGGGLTIGFAPSTTRVIVGYHKRVVLSENAEFAAFDGVNGGPWLAMAVDSGGLVNVRKNTVPYSGSPFDPGMRLSGVYRYYEHDFKMHGSAGLYTLKIDGQTVYSFTGQATGDGSTHIAYVTLAGSSISRLANLYVLDDTVGPGPNPCNTFLGPQRIFSIGPSADHAVAWTKDSGSSNFSRVNEAANDGDASYVETTTVTNEDEYDYANTGLPGVQPVLIQLNSSARVVAPSAGREIKHFVNFSGDRTEDTMVLSSDYFTQILPLAENPHTSGLITAADVDAIRAGVRLTV